MNTYVLLNVAVLTGLFLFMAYRPKDQPIKRIIGLMALLLLMTALFDSIIVGARIVSYDPNLILGWKIGNAPIEDFAYTIALAFIIPYLWKTYGKS